MLRRALVIMLIVALVTSCVGCGGSQSGGDQQNPYSDRSSNDASNGALSGDSKPPTITDVSATNVMQNSATISWTTDEAATGQVEYGTTTAYGSTSAETSLMTSHSMNITGLNPSTTYHYRVVATDESGNKAASEDYTLTTPNPAIRVVLDKVGVADDQDWWNAGDIYLAVVVGDGNGPPEVHRYPWDEGTTFQISDNQTKEVDIPVFRTDAVGDSLYLCVVAYDKDYDWEGFLVKSAISTALDYVSTGTLGIGTAEALIDNYEEMVQQQGKKGHDLVGYYEHTWYPEESWGVGTYEEVTRDDLRLWFTIDAPLGLENDADGDLIPDEQDLFPEQDMAVKVVITAFEETGDPGDGGFLGLFSSPGDPYFFVYVGGIEARSECPCFTDMSSKSYPYWVKINVPDDTSTIPIVIEVWDDDGDWLNSDDQYDVSGAPGSGQAGLCFSTTYDMTGGPYQAVADGSLDGDDTDGIQASLGIEISTVLA